MESVLIIDDDPVIQLLLRTHFEQEGYIVEVASDGEQGLRMARELKPDFVLLDVLMPKLNGLEVLKALRADPATASLMVALLSAKSEDSDRELGLGAGANAYLTKPFDPLALLDQVRQLTDAAAEGRL